MPHADEYINLSKTAAHDLAERRNMIFWLVSVDGERRLGDPPDQREDRVCIELVKGKVAAARVC